APPVDVVLRSTGAEWPGAAVPQASSVPRPHGAASSRALNSHVPITRRVSHGRWVADNSRRRERLDGAGAALHTETNRPRRTVLGHRHFGPELLAGAELGGVGRVLGNEERDRWRERRVLTWRCPRGDARVAQWSPCEGIWNGDELPVFHA